jgi:hypothetical protein
VPVMFIIWTLVETPVVVTLPPTYSGEVLQRHTTAFDPAALGFQPVDLESKAHCRHSQGLTFGEIRRLCPRVLQHRWACASQSNQDYVIPRWIPA